MIAEKVMFCVVMFLHVVGAMDLLFQDRSSKQNVDNTVSVVSFTIRTREVNAIKVFAGFISISTIT